MPAMRHVPRAVRCGAPSGALTVLLVLTAVFAAVLGPAGAPGSSGPARSPVWGVVGEVAPAGSGSGPGAEGQPSDAADSEVRGAGESARGSRRAHVRSGSRGRAAGAVASYRRTAAVRHPALDGPVEGPRQAPEALGGRRWVVLRC
ncbi:hypothetical protein AS594_16890 [Streptomyces agglomeratus]|uniref:Uncharacterized protein n=1 Tax=Streptomyces agglomeratus TaxID=285458 RepID=A0A1E5P8V4_9ACTN|nr:hypothetical protein [Streptomyces agglomeratus]OEJ25925.1 hypothetical protein AS594_16890 [Streptomyces agglomeratus]OEJ52569.1 hypothetical protein BGK72_19135 [Streptomyces agglomeratus]